MERIKIDTGACQVPCEGTFVDVRKTDPGSFQVDNTDMFLKRYENYKKFYEKSSGNEIMYMRIPPEEPHMPVRLVFFLGDFSCLS